jgi:hypothetical protein
MRLENGFIDTPQIVSLQNQGDGMKKINPVLFIALFLLSIILFSCDKRNITEPRLAHDGDISYYWYPGGDTIAFALDIPMPHYVYACIISNCGELVRSVYDEPMGAGTHMYLWDLKDNNGRMLDEGYYAFYFKADFYEDIAWVKYEK